MIEPLDTGLLRTFVAVVDAGGLTRAARRLRLSQPSVSVQMRRLEEKLGVRLLDRGARTVQPTADGEMLAAYARRILALSEEAVTRIGAPALAGTVRLGTPEDFATTHLPDVLARFARAHPHVALEVTTDLTLNLLDRFRTGAFDVLLIKRERIGPTEGVRVWREPLVWAAARAALSLDVGPLPLVVSPHPCVYRQRAIRALDGVGRPWRIAYTSTSLAGAQAAVRAALGVAVLPKAMVPPDFVVLRDGLPDLSDTEIALMTAAAPAPPALRLADHIIRSLERPSDDRDPLRIP